jgi:ATP-dependent helicase HrpB
MIFNQKHLPIDDVLDDVRRALCKHQTAVLQAEPGAGKTTRVPLALLEEPWLAGKRILMLEPRRLAATNAAKYMASCRGESVGDTVGYAIRFDRRVTQTTRLEVVTEGILTRRLQTDPMLEGGGLVIFDEFHERSLHSDLALALCRDAQLGLREDLKLLVMSATLDGDAVARLLGDAPLLRCPGRRHPVDICYLPQEPRGPLPEVAARAVRRAARETVGDILVFLPGAAEIRRCRELLQEPAVGDVQVCPLYGELPFAEQERALRPGARRKVVLATNIAETSLTIEGVRVVVDTGFMRQARFDPGSGLSRLVTARITAANAEQRAGRAGRLGPGRCYRLWTEASHGGLLPFSPPEIRHADLTPLALELARWGGAGCFFPELARCPAGRRPGCRPGFAAAIGSIGRQGTDDASGRGHGHAADPSADCRFVAGRAQFGMRRPGLRSGGIAGRAGYAPRRQTCSSSCRLRSAGAPRGFAGLAQQNLFGGWHRSGCVSGCGPRRRCLAEAPVFAEARS